MLRRDLRFGRNAERESGNEIAEAAFVLPLLFMLLFGILWFGQAFRIYATVNRAAREAAQAAAVPSCASCGNAFRNATYIQNNVVNPVLLAAHLDPSRVQAFNLQQNQILNVSSNPQEHGAIVSFSYPFSFKLNGITCCPPALVPITNGITISVQAQAREEQ
jgi:Flp pilus assembly protein TadG